tara:strand:+ start:1803 stop:4424 length:2622 start_codon:yes stop_codon:yes gene_type:complete
MISARLLLLGVAGLALPTASFAQTDDCTSPAPLTGLGAFAFDTTGFVAGSGILSPCASIADDGYFVWTAPSTGSFTIDTCGTTFDTQLAVYAGSDCNATCIASNDDECGSQSAVTVPSVTSGDLFLIRVGSAFVGFGSTGVMNIQTTLAPPANDTCATPTSIVGPGPFVWDNSLATTSNFTEGGCGAGVAVPAVADVFFAWTAGAAGDYTFSTCGTGGSTVINLYEGDDCSATCVGDSGNNDACGEDDTFNLLGADMGDVYLVQLGMWFSSDPLTTSGLLSVSGISPPPANDTCATGTPISGAGTFPYDTTDATESNFDGNGTAPCSGIPMHRDAFFVWTAPTSEAYEFDTIGAGFDTRLSAHLGDDCSATCVATDSNSGGGTTSRLTVFGITAGQEYLIQVGGFDSANAGPANLNVAVAPPTPTNDSCATAMPVSGIGTWAFDNTDASTTGFDGGTCSSSVFRDVFFAWTASAPGNYTIDTCTTSYDTRLSLHSGPAGCASTCLGQNDDKCNLQSSVSLTGIQVGDEVLVQLGSFGATSGPGFLNIDFTPAPVPNDTCATPMLIPTLGTVNWNNTMVSTSGFDGGDPVLCQSPLNSDTSPIGKIHNDLFFTYTAECNGNFRFTTEGSTGVTDTRLNLHSGANCTAFCVGSNDNVPGGGGNLLSAVTMTGVTTGDAFLIQVGTWTEGTATGDGVLTVERIGGPCMGPGLTISCDPASDHFLGQYVKLDSSSMGSGFGSDLHLEATDGPPGEFGFFLISMDASLSLPVFNGVLCIGSPSARYNSLVATNQSKPELNSIGQFDASGVLQSLVGNAPSTGGSGFDVPLDLPFAPAGTQIASGDQWFFQLWYRDQIAPLPNPGSSANFSNVVGVVFP